MSVESVRSVSRGGCSPSEKLPGPRSLLRRVLSSTLLTAVLMLVVLESGLRIPVERLAFVPGPLLVELVLLWLLVLVVYAVTASLRAAVVVSLLVALLVAMVNGVRVSMLGGPVTPVDFAFLGAPGFLVSMVPATMLIWGVVFLVVTAVTLAWVVRKIPDLDPIDEQGAGRARLGLRILVVLMAVAVALSSVRFHESNNALRSVYEASGAAWKPWSQMFNHEVNGFLGAL